MSDKKALSLYDAFQVVATQTKSFSGHYVIDGNQVTIFNGILDPSVWVRTFNGQYQFGEKMAVFINQVISEGEWSLFHVRSDTTGLNPGDDFLDVIFKPTRDE